MKNTKNSKEKIKDQKPKTNEDDKQRHMEIGDFHNPRKIITYKGWETPSFH
jgi:hypothetical protein